MAELLEQLTELVPAAANLEELARPILQVMHTITGMESTYFTTIDTDRGVQSVKFASNNGALQIPENLEVPWRDTLCKRALDEGRRFENNVADCWGDSEAAKALGIRTYLSTAVKNSEGQVMGTLCAASAESHTLNERSLATMDLFSKLIALYMEREVLLRRLAHQNGRLASQAMHDALTGLPNRRALEDKLGRLLADAERDGTWIDVAMIDLDGFKRINDEHGHKAGDLFLQQVADRLTANMRAGDFVVRLGGDEFVSVSPAALRTETQSALHTLALKHRLTLAATGEYDLGVTTIRYGGPSVGVVRIAPGAATPEEAVKQADAAMYAVKRERKATR